MSDLTTQCYPIPWKCQRRRVSVLYRHNRKASGYGMKFWPDDYDALKSKIPQIADLGDFLN